MLASLTDYVYLGAWTDPFFSLNDLRIIAISARIQCCIAPSRLFTGIIQLTKSTLSHKNAKSDWKSNSDSIYNSRNTKPKRFLARDIGLGMITISRKKVLYGFIFTRSNFIPTLGKNAWIKLIWFHNVSKEYMYLGAFREPTGDNIIQPSLILDILEKTAATFHRKLPLKLCCIEHSKCAKEI